MSMLEEECLDGGGRNNYNYLSFEEQDELEGEDINDCADYNPR
ncbi:hypothetical protein [Desulfosporosinus lacus]|nr:hypothetical protein [Desulfosporosinus lacus]